MAKEIITLPEQDISILRELIRDYRANKNLNTQLGFEQDELTDQTPDTHLFYLGSDTCGTHIDPATTSGIAGTARLPIYHPGTSGVPKYTGYKQTVHNPWRHKYNYEWLLATKTKRGKYVVSAPHDVPRFALIQYAGALTVDFKVPGYPNWVKADGITNSIANGGSGNNYSDVFLRGTSANDDDAPSDTPVGTDQICIPLHTASEVAASLKDHDLSDLGTQYTGTSSLSLTVGSITPDRIAAALEDHTGYKTGTSTTGITVGTHTAIEVASQIADHITTITGFETTGLTVGSHTGADIANLLSATGTAEETKPAINVQDHTGTEVAATLQNHTVNVGTNSTGITVGTHTGFLTGANSTGITVDPHAGTQTGSASVTGTTSAATVPSHTGFITGNSSTGITVGTHTGLNTGSNTTGITVDPHSSQRTGSATTVGGRTDPETIDPHTGFITCNSATGITVGTHSAGFTGTEVTGITVDPHTGDRTGSATVVGGNTDAATIPAHVGATTNTGNANITVGSHTGILTNGTATGITIADHTTDDVGNALEGHGGDQTGTSTTGITETDIDGAHTHDLGTTTVIFCVDANNPDQVIALSGVTIESGGTHKHDISDPSHSHSFEGLNHVGTGTSNNLSHNINDPGHAHSVPSLGHSVTPGGHAHTLPTLTHGTHSHSFSASGTHSHDFSTLTHNVDDDGHRHTTPQLTHSVSDPEHNHGIPQLTHGTHSHAFSASGTHSHDLSTLTHNVNEGNHSHSLPSMGHSVNESTHNHTIPELTHGTHTHTFSSGTHSHEIPSLSHNIDDPTHSHTIPALAHVVDDPGHDHTVTITAHQTSGTKLTHTVTGGTHTHELSITITGTGEIGHTVNEVAHRHTTPTLEHTGSGDGLGHNVEEGDGHNHTIPDLTHSGTGSNIVLSTGSTEHRHSFHLTGLLPHEGTGDGLRHGTGTGSMDYFDIRGKHKNLHMIEKIQPWSV